MSNLELLAKKGEKNLLKDMFRDSSDSDVSHFSDSDDDLPAINDSQDESIDDASNTHLKADQFTFTSHSRQIEVIIQQQAQKGIAHQLWPAAMFLCDYIENHMDIVGQHRTIVELGSGVGLVGIHLSKLLGEGIEVIMTDLNEAIPLMNQNITINHVDHNVKAMELSWGSKTDFDTVMQQLSQPTVPPLVVAADCVYWECLYEPFLQTLLSFAELGSTIIIAHVKRWKKDNKFFANCKKRHLTVEILHEVVDTTVNEHTQVESRRVTRIYKITK